MEKQNKNNSKLTEHQFAIIYKGKQILPRYFPMLFSLHTPLFFTMHVICKPKLTSIFSGEMNLIFFKLTKWDAFRKGT